MRFNNYKFLKNKKYQNTNKFYILNVSDRLRLQISAQVKPILLQINLSLYLSFKRNFMQNMRKQLLSKKLNNNNERPKKIVLYNFGKCSV